MVADGVFGDETEQAVRAFQRAHDLVDDGVVGPRTWAALEGQPPPDAAAVAFPTTLPPDHAALSAELAEAAKYRDFA
ncbi:MAG TPA: peptidoglycan-binding domain-containing protein, partial [Polyangiaceae bacterium]|nr:peptidoglycan-binding domain-containing protein [Polyangiaceae bacterium]